MGGTSGDHVEVQPAESKLEIYPVSRLQGQEKFTAFSWWRYGHDGSCLGWEEWSTLYVASHDG